MKLTKAEREAAAHILAVNASSQEVPQIYFSTISSINVRVACSTAFTAACGRTFTYGYGNCHDDERAVYGEAEALLRSGWSPGDSVMRLDTKEFV